MWTSIQKASNWSTISTTNFQGIQKHNQSSFWVLKRTELIFYLSFFFSLIFLLSFEEVNVKVLFCHQVRKEKLGDRITALQQLVSPFGKVSFWIFLLFSNSTLTIASLCFVIRLKAHPLVIYSTFFRLILHRFFMKLLSISSSSMTKPLYVILSSSSYHIRVFHSLILTP